MKKRLFCIFLLLLAPVIARSETTMHHISMQVISYRSFAAADMCHVNSLLYGKIIQQRANGLDKAAMEEKLDVSSAPSVRDVVDAAYKLPIAQSPDPEHFYKTCAEKQQADIQKDIAAMPAS